MANIDYLVLKSYESFEVAQQLDADSQFDHSVVMFGLSTEQLLTAVKLAHPEQSFGGRLKDYFEELQVLTQQAKFGDKSLVTSEFLEGVKMRALVIFSQLDKVLKETLNLGQGALLPG